jgi:Ca2+-binding EF-hand superfamily protein
MAPDALKNGLDFATFARWLAKYWANERRKLRRQIKETFDLYDTDKSGVLEAEEFKMVRGADWGWRAPRLGKGDACPRATTGLR